MKRPFEISLRYFLIRAFNNICDINTKQGVTIECLKSDVGNSKDTNLKNIS